MMIKKMILVCAITLTLAGCKNNDSPNTVSPIPQESTKVATETKHPIAFDYTNHNHPDEEKYETILGEPSKLSTGEPVIAKQEEVRAWNGEFSGFIKDVNSGYDIRSCDMSEVNFNVVENYNDLTFDSNTIWPKTLPEGFDPGYILESNKNPGLGIRALHDNGITGNGVGIAIIDQALLLEHEQYKDNLMYYEKIHCIDDSAQMHGPAVASIAVGNTIGVAPGAKLYYIATTHGHFNNAGDFEYDASIIADCIIRVLEINKELPENEKIRVISISKGYDEGDKGYAELTNAIDSANKQNILVLTTTTEAYYHFPLRGMDRDYIKDPDDFYSYAPEWWKADEFYSDPSSFQDNILVPMGSRTIASFTGAKDYAIACRGGSSWAVPWCAGFYALCCQVKPQITPEEFFETLKSTGVTVDLNHDGQIYKFGTIVNPAEVIEKLHQ